MIALMVQDIHLRPLQKNGFWLKSINFILHSMVFYYLLTNCGGIGNYKRKMLYSILYLQRTITLPWRTLPHFVTAALLLTTYDFSTSLKRQTPSSFSIQKIPLDCGDVRTSAGALLPLRKKKTLLFSALLGTDLSQLAR